MKQRALFLLVAILLAACGQKGGLYLPEQASEQEEKAAENASVAPAE